MWPIPQECVDLVTFTEKTFMEKLNFVFFVQWKTQETEAADHECSKE